MNVNIGYNCRIFGRVSQVDFCCESEAGGRGGKDVKCADFGGENVGDVRSST